LFVARPIVVLFAVVLVMVATMVSTGVQAASPNGVAVASAQVSSLEERLDALGVRNAVVQPTGGGAMVSFTYNGQFYNFQAVSSDGVMSITEIPGSVLQGGQTAHLAAPSASGGFENVVSNNPGRWAPTTTPGGGTNYVGVTAVGSPAVCILGTNCGPPPCPSCPMYYWVTFEESGLPSGAVWNVTYSGEGVAENPSETAPTNIIVDLENGTYSYQAVSSSSTYGYYAAEGSFTVNGEAVTVHTTLTKVSGDPPSGLSQACWIAIIESGIESAFLIAAIVACATTGAGCLVLYFLVNYDGVSIPVSIVRGCDLNV
jgi:hypothetical protein